MAMTLMARGYPDGTRVSGLLDGDAPYYDGYETADGRHLSVAPLEGRFYDEFVRIAGLQDAPRRDDPAGSDALRARIAARIAQRSMADWVADFEGTDACVAGVLTLREAARHPHNVERGVFVEPGGQLQPAPAPRFSRTPPSLTTAPEVPGASTREALTAWGIADVEALIAAGVAVQSG